MPEATAGARFRTTLRTQLERSAKGSTGRHVVDGATEKLRENSRRNEEEMKRVPQDKKRRSFPSHS